MYNKLISDIVSLFEYENVLDAKTINKLVKE